MTSMTSEKPAAAGGVTPQTPLQADGQLNAAAGGRTAKTPPQAAGVGVFDVIDAVDAVDVIDSGHC
jgi:hypothetical protein